MISKDILLFISKLKPGELFIASEIHEKYFSDVKEATFHQLLNRFSLKNELVRYSKGIYYKPSNLCISNTDVINLLTSNKSRGFVSGEFLLYDKGIIDDVVDKEVLTIYRNFKWSLVNVGPFTIRSLYSKTEFSNRDFLEMLEVIYFILKTNYKINYKKAYLYFKSRLHLFSLEDFDFLFDRRFYIRSYFSNAVYLFESLGLNTGLDAICRNYRIDEKIINITKEGNSND